MSERGERFLRPCDARHSGSRKDDRLSHSSLVIKGEHGHSQCRQLGDGGGRAETKSLFVWE